MLKKKKYLIGGLILIAALIFLGYLGFMGGLTYYYEVDELLDEEIGVKPVGQEAKQIDVQCQAAG